MSNCIDDSFLGENTSTPIDRKQGYNKNKNFFEYKEEKNNKSGNNVNKFSDYKNKNNKVDKDFGEMQTPILLNTPKLTGRIIDAKLNLFEKVKNIKNEKKNHKICNNKIIPNKHKEDNSTTENEEIIDQEISISSNKNTLNNNTLINNKHKNRNQNRFKYKKIIINGLSNVLDLNEDCIKVIFSFFDLQMINTFTLLSRKYYNCVKFIINQKIKDKILKYYEENENKYNNKIKLSLMKISPLSRISPLLLHKKYVDLLLENNNKYDKEIQKDLTRTFPDNISFKYGNNNYNRLYHLLTVYSLYNQKIGYAQGINFLAAHILLLYDKEEEGFVFFDALLQKFEFEKLLGIENELHNKLYNLKLCLKKYCPDISRYLESLHLSHEFFTTNWMITLFSNSMDETYLFRVWDFLIIFGWKFFRYFVISILNFYKKNIFEEEQNKLTFYMKNILKNENFKENFNKIIKNTFELMDKDNNVK